MINGFVEDGLYRAFGFNPCVAMHELRIRMRGVRLFRGLLYCTLAGVIAIGVAFAAEGRQWRQARTYAPQPQVHAAIGRETFAVLAYTQLTLVLFLLPAYGAGAIAMEREKHTLEMLRATLVSPSDVVTGKLLSVVAVGGMLLAATIPIGAWCLPLGGIAPWELACAYVLLLAATLFAVPLALLFSAGSRQSMAAVVRTYLVLIVLLAGVPALDKSPGSVPGTVWVGGVPIGTGPFFELPFWAAFGWMLFKSLQWLWLQSRAGERLAPKHAAVALAVALVVICVGTWAVAPANTAVCTGLDAAMALHPYFALSGLLAPELGPATVAPFGLIGPQPQVVRFPPARGPQPYSSRVAPSYAPTTRSTGMSKPSTRAQLYSWAVSTVAMTFIGLALWGVSIKVFAARSTTDARPT